MPPIAVPESIAVLKRLRALSAYVDLTVLGAADGGDSFATAPDSDLVACLPAGVEVIRVPWPRRREYAALKATTRAVFLHSGLVAAADLIWASRVRSPTRDRRWVEGFDRIISDSSPIVSHVVAGRLRSRSSRPAWTQHYSDPFVDLTYRRYHPLSRAIDARAERRLLDAADRVTVTSPETRDLLLDRHGRRRSDLASILSVVPNVYDPDLMALATAKYRHLAAFPGDGVVHAAYVGHFYGRRSIRPLCRWVDWRRARGAGRIPLKLHVFGSLRASERELVTAQYANAIELHAPVPYLHSLAVMAATDVLLVVDAPSDGPSVHFPSKLADYLGAARPIVAFTPPAGATARITAETGHVSVPVVASPEDFERVEAAIACRGRHVAPPPEYANTFDSCAPLLA